MNKSSLKYSNLYDKDGNLIRKVNPNTGKLDDYTIEEVEELELKLRNDVDESGKPKKPVELANVRKVLAQMYRDPKNFEYLLNKYAKTRGNDAEDDNKEAYDKLVETAKQLKEEAMNEPEEQVEQKVPNLDPEYVDFEEITEDENVADIDK